MFDLDVIEKDWKENSFRLTDKEIRQIYISEGVTTKAFSEKLEELEKKKKYGTADDKLIDLIFGKPKVSKFDDFESNESLLLAKEPFTIDDIDNKIDDDICDCFPSEEEMEEIVELQMKELREKKEELESQTFSFDEYFRRRRELKKTFRLSRESQMKIVEGCMDLVFDETRGYYQQLDKKVSMEEIYYLCLESLISAVKYCIHYTTKDCFRSYAASFMRRNIVNYMAKKEGISYKNAYCITFKLFNPDLSIYGDENMELYDVREFSYDYDRETPYKPSAIYNMTKDESYDIDYTKDISSEEFMNTYNKAISELDDIDKKIMGLVYDKDGESVLTHAEIADILGVDVNKLINTKRKVKNRLRNDYRFNKYKD